MVSCTQILSDLGYKTKPPTGNVKLEDLPIVFAMKQTAPPSVVGGKEPDVSKKTLEGDTVSGAENRLMILYHASQTEEVGTLIDLLGKTVDVPGRLVLIEGMLVEVKESGAKELGVQWEAFGKNWQKATFLSSAGGATPFMFFYDPEFTPPVDLAERVRATLRAVIEDGKGDILSLPSVLVLSNRNAKIQVIEEVPIFKTVITETTSKVEVDFKTVGIILNIKPRISRDGDTVALQILVEVSEAPEEDFITVQDQALAPLINRRIVETVARVQNNTPFIIGGLIRNESAETTERIPIISRIPLLGLLFQNRSARREKREVIIVLTPRVIKTGGAHRAVLPKDGEQFDFLDNRLFRNSYRLRAEDVFDLRFLEDNPVVQQAFADTIALVRRHPAYGKRSPFKEMAASIIPGEDALVIRMIYEVVKKLRLHERIKPENLIFFKKDESKPAGFRVRWLVDELAEAVGGDVLRAHKKKPCPERVLEAYFARPSPKQVLFLSYTREAHAPVADMKWVSPGEGQTVERHMLDVHRTGDDGLYHEFTLAIDSAKDLERLQVALALREVAKVNDFEDLFTLRNFRVGRKIAIPELGDLDTRVFLLDQDTAQYFFKSDYYYSALQTKLGHAYDALAKALETEGMQ
jgi:Flp pilus assembly secretin CpaC